MRQQIIQDLNELTFYHDNPRTHVRPEYIETLAESIRQKGVLTPIITRDDPNNPGKKQVIAGACRLKASQLLERLGQLPPTFSIQVQHFGQLSDQDAFEIAITENVHREDMGDHQKVKAIARVATTRGLQAAADKLGLKVPQVKQAVEIAQADPGILQKLEEGQINLGQAHQLSLLPRDLQLEFLEQTVTHGWTSKDLREASKKQLIPMSVARFPLKWYKKDYTSPLFGEEPCFLDKQEFLRLQFQWLEEEKDRRTGYQFVSVGQIPEGFERVLDPKSTPESSCGLVLNVDIHTGEVTERLVQQKRELSPALPAATRTVKRNMRPEVYGGQARALKLHQTLEGQEQAGLLVLVWQLLMQDTVKVDDHASGMYGLHPLLKTQGEGLVRKLQEQGLPVALSKNGQVHPVAAADTGEVMFRALKQFSQEELVKLMTQLALQTVTHPEGVLFKLLAQEQELQNAFDGNWEAYLNTLDREGLLEFIEQHGLRLQVHPEQKKRDIVKMLMERELELSVITPAEFVF